MANGVVQSTDFESAYKAGASYISELQEEYVGSNAKDIFKADFNSGYTKQENNVMEKDNTNVESKYPIK